MAHSKDKNRERRPLWKRALVAVTAMLLGMLVVEFGMRTWLFGSAAFSFAAVDSVQRLGYSGMVQAADHPDVIYELKPNVTRRFKLQEFRTNSIGLRDDEYALKKPADIFRVAVLGDSYTMGSGVAIEDVYHSVLEAMLNARTDARSYEFLNFGVGGLNLRDYWAVLQDKAAAFKPDLVLIGYTASNDHLEWPEESYQEVYTPHAQRGAFFNSFVYMIIRRSLTRDVVERPRGSYYFPREIDFVRRYFRRFRNYSREQQVPVVVAFLSNTAKKKRSDEIALIAGEEGLGFIDATLAFRGTNRDEWSIYAPLDSHPNSAAHKHFARSILTGLESLGILPGKD